MTATTTYLVLLAVAAIGLLGALVTGRKWNAFLALPAPAPLVELGWDGRPRRG